MTVFQSFIKSHFTKHIVFLVSYVKQCLSSFLFFTHVYLLSVEVFANRIPEKMRKLCFPLEILFLKAFSPFTILRWNRNRIWNGFPHKHKSYAPRKSEKPLKPTGIYSLCLDHNLSSYNGITFIDLFHPIFDISLNFFSTMNFLFWCLYSEYCTLYSAFSV